MTDITDEQRAAVEWLRTLQSSHPSKVYRDRATETLAALPAELTNPQPVLPTEPGWYLAPVDSSPSGMTAIELLGTGEWVDSTDPQYLRDSWVADHMPLTRLVPERPQITREQVKEAIYEADVSGLLHDDYIEVAYRSLMNQVNDQ